MCTPHTCRSQCRLWSCPHTCSGQSEMELSLFAPSHSQTEVQTRRVNRFLLLATAPGNSQICKLQNAPLRGRGTHGKQEEHTLHIEQQVPRCVCTSLAGLLGTTASPHVHTHFNMGNMGKFTQPENYLFSFVLIVPFCIYLNSNTNAVWDWGCSKCHAAVRLNQGNKSS